MILTDLIRYRPNSTVSNENERNAFVKYEPSLAVLDENTKDLLDDIIVHATCDCSYEDDECEDK